jgi:hypothetical protein
MLTRRGFAGFASCALCGLAEFAATEVSAQGTPPPREGARRPSLPRRQQRPYRSCSPAVRTQLSSASSRASIGLGVTPLAC